MKKYSIILLVDVIIFMIIPYIRPGQEMIWYLTCVWPICIIQGTIVKYLDEKLFINCFGIFLLIIIDAIHFSNTVNNRFIDDYYSSVINCIKELQNIIWWLPTIGLVVGYIIGCLIIRLSHCNQTD